MDNIKRIPVLRFPEFKDELSAQNLASMTSKIGDGLHSTPAYDDLGDYYFINGNNLVNGSVVIHPNTKRISYEEFLTHKRTLNDTTILLSINGTIGELALYRNEKVILGKSACYLNVSKEYDKTFVYCILQSPQIKRFFLSELTGTTIRNLSLTSIKKAQLFIPSLAEQQKIAAFITAVDDKIQQLSKKKALLEKYKKGVMQQIFNQEIRFKDENGKDFPAWEDARLGELLNYEQPTKYIVNEVEYNNSHQTPVLTAGKTFILGYTNEVKGIFKDNLPVIIFDDFTTATKFVDFPFKVKSSAMKILLAKEGVDAKFVYEAMQNINYEIGGHGRHWISVFSQIMLLMPTLKEQTKIANFLSSIDNKINQVHQQIEQTKLYKNGLLQQMFV